MGVRQAFRGMRRAATRPLAAMAVAILAVGVAAEAGGQVVAPAGGYGGYGWGGWGADSATGNAFRGLGAFSAGLGAGDLQSSRADAVRTQSFMELNEYLYRSAMVHRQQAAAAREARDQDVAEARDSLRDRRLNDPTPRDIESGDALNNLLFEIDNPAIPDSVLRDASQGMALPGVAVQKIPFMFTHKGVAVSLQRLSTEGEGWPAALKADALSPLRGRYEALIERILEVPDGEEVPAELIGEARSTLGEMYRAIQTAGLPGPVAAESLRHLKAQAGMVAMLQQPDVKQVLDEAAEVEEVDLPRLLNFMRAFNLQFGAADTPEEKLVYSQQLYPMLAQVRGGLAEQFGGQLPGSGDSEEQFAGSPAGAFEGFDWEQLGITSGNPPAPGDQPAPADAPGEAPRRGAPGLVDPGNN